MSSIVLAGKYAQVSRMSVHAKNWAVRPKKPQPGREQRVKGNVKMQRDFATEQLMPLPVTHFDRADEMVKGMAQASNKMLDKFRYPDQASATNEEKQFGNGRWSHELVKQICKANPNLFVEDSLNVPGCAGFYKVVNFEKVAAGKPNASFRHGFMPENTIMKEDRACLVTEFIYGWRQVLIRLRRSGDLTAGQFKKLYGVVSYNDERGKHLASDLGEFAVT